jgi:hypothetical protein
VFEWNGSMIHAKTAVADGRWARVGSTNLNIASWLGNRELDVIVEHESFAREMEEMFLHDLHNTTEVVLQRNRVRGNRTWIRPRAPRTRSPRLDKTAPANTTSNTTLERHDASAGHDKHAGHSVEMFRNRAFYALVDVLAAYTEACPEGVFAPSAATPGQASSVTVSDRSALKGLTQFLTQFVFLSSTTGS